MPEAIVVAKATGGWSFHFSVTEAQARELLHARVGDTVHLNEPGEMINITSATVMTRSKDVPGGATHEELVRQSVKDELRNMIRSNAWSGVNGDGY